MKKSITLLLMTIGIAISCSKFDDTAIWDKLNDHEARLAYLEEICEKMNTDIINLQTIVTALETNDYIVNASPLATGDGYTLIFKSGKSLLTLNAKVAIHSGSASPPIKQTQVIPLFVFIRLANVSTVSSVPISSAK